MVRRMGQKMIMGQAKIGFRRHLRSGSCPRRSSCPGRWDGQTASRWPGVGSRTDRLGRSGRCLAEAEYGTSSWKVMFRKDVFERRTYRTVCLLAMCPHGLKAWSRTPESRWNDGSIPIDNCTILSDSIRQIGHFPALWPLLMWIPHSCLPWTWPHWRYT